MNHYTNILSYCTDVLTRFLIKDVFPTFVNIAYAHISYSRSLIFTILHKIVYITALVIAYAIYRCYYILHYIYLLHMEK